jgi:hypothetical protein
MMFTANLPRVGATSVSGTIVSGQESNWQHLRMQNKMKRVIRFPALTPVNSVSGYVRQSSGVRIETIGSRSIIAVRSFNHERA